MPTRSARRCSPRPVSSWSYCFTEIPMPTEVEADDIALVVAEVDERFRIHDERSASWVVRKVVEERAHRQRVAAWFAAETRRSERREQFVLHRFGAELSDWAQQQLAQQFGKR